MAFRVAAAAFFLCLSFWTAQTKIYDRCELARELRDVHEIPEQQLATWICIANYESHFNTSAHNPGSGDHGIFQISELYWCSPPGNGYACGLPCNALKDEDIEDDVICARRIYRQHQRISRDGFTAWVVYNLHCRNPAHVASWIQGCFDEENLVKYGYEPMYEAMNLPTMRVPMPSSPPSPSVFPTPPLSSPLSSSPSIQPSPTTKPPGKVPTHAKVQDKSRIESKPSRKPATTPKPQISTYKPLLNLSSTLPSSTASHIFTSPQRPTQFSTYKSASSTFQTSPVTSGKFSISTVQRRPTNVSINKPKPLIQRSSAISIKPATPTSNKVSIYKPVSVSSTFGTFPLTSAKPSIPQRLSKVSTYRPLSSTFRTSPATSIKVTTPKPQISTYKPFLNQFSSTFQTSLKSSQRLNKISSAFRTSPFVTTPKPPTTVSTYKPFLNQFSTVYKPQVSSTKSSVGFSIPQQYSSTIAAYSGLTASPSAKFSSSTTFINPNPSLFINNDEFSKAALVKPREIKTSLPFTLKSGVKPFEFNRNENIYAFVNNKNGYSYAISSNGFKLFRTAN